MDSCAKAANASSPRLRQARLGDLGGQYISKPRASIDAQRTPFLLLMRALDGADFAFAGPWLPATLLSEASLALAQPIPNTAETCRGRGRAGHSSAE
jgi:hypothetical protein